MLGVNFFWGVLVFQEPVANILGTIGAFVCLGVGLVGMSHFSAPREKVAEEERQHLLEDDEMESMSSISVDRFDLSRERSLSPNENGTERDAVEEEQTWSSGGPPEDASRIAASGDIDTDVDGQTSIPEEDDDCVVLFGHSISKRTSGIAAAALNGLVGGSSLIPLHFAKQHGFAGATFVISFAVGALIANTLLWFFLFLYCFYTIPGVLQLNQSRLKQAIEGVPCWHLRELWLPGLIAGKRCRHDPW